MWTRTGKTILAAVAGGLLLGGPAAAAQPTFPDVPPWHWAYDAVMKLQQAGVFTGYPTPPAELAENSLIQVYDGFAHAGAPGAQRWVERFTYNRPAGWPAPLQHTQIEGFSLTTVQVAVRADTATSTFTAAVRTRDGKTATIPMRIGLRHNGQDWQVDYAALAAGSPLFR